MGSNLGVRSNLMVLRDHGLWESERFAGRPAYEEVIREPYKYLPGDLVKLLYPEITDKRIIKDKLTAKQIHELDQYLVCQLCHRTCAGTCAGSAVT